MKLLRLCVLAGLSLYVAQSPGQQPKAIDLQAPDALDSHNVTMRPVTYLGRAAVQVADPAVADLGDAERFAVVKGTSFQDGAIEVDLSGDTLPNAGEGARGFVGISFRVSADRSHFECFYLRPKNGRADDQLRRNHSTQYISMPGFPWEKLRAETPGKYESYVDLVPGQWTHVKVEVAGSIARLYVNGAAQPVLIVNDLKQPTIKGGIALFVGPGTIAHFSNLRVAP